MRLDQRRVFVPGAGLSQFHIPKALPMHKQTLMMMLPLGKWGIVEGTPGSCPGPGIGPVNICA